MKPADPHGDPLGALVTLEDALALIARVVQEVYDGRLDAKRGDVLCRLLRAWIETSPLRKAETVIKDLTAKLKRAETLLAKHGIRLVA